MAYYRASGGPVITNQPGIDAPPGYGASPSAPLPSVGGWPPSNMICLPGLESLISLNKIFIDQRIDPFEALTGFDRKKRYTAVNEFGQPIFVLREDSGWFMRGCLGSERRFEIKVFDGRGVEAIRMKRPITFIGDEVNVYNGETLLGSVHRIPCTCAPELMVYDNIRKPVLKIIGPFCICGFDIEFTIYANNGTEIGVIKKQWSGMLREMFTDADVFGVAFPHDLEVNVKALLLAASVLIDFVYFENR